MNAVTWVNIIDMLSRAPEAPNTNTPYKIIDCLWWAEEWLKSNKQTTEFLAIIQAQMHVERAMKILGFTWGELHFYKDLDSANLMLVQEVAKLSLESLDAILANLREREKKG